MFNFTIPADGSSVPAADFADAAKAALATLVAGDEEKAQAKAAADAAIALVKAGHIGAENIYAVIGGIGNPGHAIGPGGGSIISIDIHQRSAPAQPVPVPEPAPAPPKRSPYETGATEAEIAREAVATGKTPEQAAAALGAPAPAQLAAKPAAPSASKTAKAKRKA